MAHAQRRWRGVRQALREAHHHQVRAHLAACARAGVLLRWRGYEFEEEVLEVAFVHGDAEGTWREYCERFARDEGDGRMYRQFCRRARGRSSSRRRARRARFVFGL